MHYVYILASEPSPGRFYVGLTADLDQRLKEHNSGKSSHTAKYEPWKLATYIAFADRRKAFRFERYLKSGSGRAFAKRHF
jgi:predicted GIY-YIG superfamily endonuclease